MATTGTDEAFPVLTEAQLARLRSYGEPSEVIAGEVLFRAGDASYDFVLIDSGAVEILSNATAESDEAVVVTHGAGRFIGELNLLTGQKAYLTARVAQPGQVHRISPAQFRRLMDSDPELSDLILRALLARRVVLRDSPAALTVEILGSGMSAAALALRTYAARQQLPHTWVEADTPDGVALAGSIGASLGDLPAVIAPDTVLLRATPGMLAEALGLSYRPGAASTVDLVVVGGGPAGLAAAVYGASEGLDTLLLDAVAAGGQAAASSRIENYLGFTSGISGAELTGRAAVQAQKFGARIASPCPVARLETGGEHLRVVLGDGTDISARTVVIATGARYRALPLDRWADFEGAGIYYAATELEARACGANTVAVVGGANSAGQAALYLAGRGSHVTLVVRGPDLTAGMSAYLADRIVAHPRVTVRVGTEVTGLHGTDHLDAITVTDRAAGTGQEQPCQGLFCFIGAVPATDWLTGIILDDHGFVLTDAALHEATLDTAAPRHVAPPGGLDASPVWAALGRPPLPFETSQPGVFAAGDVRAGSMKRVAAAVGEGASAIRSVHVALGSAVV
jgi:thioredoxin reductase (NADPH)